MFGFKKKYKINAVFKNNSTKIMSNNVIRHMELCFIVSVENIIKETKIYPIVGDVIFSNGYMLNISSRTIHAESKTITYNISHHVL